MKNLPFNCLLITIILYAACGTPTPDHIGLVEILAAAGLFMAAGGLSAAALVWRPLPPGWPRAGLILLLYGLTIPVIGGVVNGSSLSALSRDLIPFLFIMLPLFVLPVIRNADSKIRNQAIVVVALAGILFSWRVLWPVWQARLDPAAVSPPTDPFYLANAPTVLFAAILCGGWAARLLYDRINVLRAGAAVLLAVLASGPLMAMMMITQRASMGMVLAAAVVLFCAGLRQRPVRLMIPLAAMILAGWLAEGFLAAVAAEVARKTAAVGLNMRWQEALAVLRALENSPLTMLWGRGWGASFASPAVGGMTVNFTHSLITTYLLKTGLCGLAIVLAYLFHLGWGVRGLLQRNPVLAMALAAPVLIDIFLYASFKSLDFGLILLLVALWGPQLHKNTAASTIGPGFPDHRTADFQA